MGGPNASLDAQQAMVNLFADMGVQPELLQSVLQAAEQSTDFAPPTASVISADPFVLGQQMTIHGSASDTGGGVVAGVEVSVDGGTRWHPASGTTAWSYSWSPLQPGEYVLETRAVDDSLNIQQPQMAGYLDVGSASASAIFGHEGSPDFMFGGGGANNIYEVRELNDQVIQPNQKEALRYGRISHLMFLPANVEGLVLGNITGMVL